MKTAVSLPDDVFHAADALAKKMGVSRSRLVTSALADYLAKHNEEAITEAYNAVYATEDSRLDPALRRLQARSIPREQW